MRIVIPVPALAALLPGQTPGAEDTVMHDAMWAFILFFGATVVGGLGLLALGIKRRRDYARFGLLTSSTPAHDKSEPSALEHLARGTAEKERALVIEKRERHLAEEDARVHRALLARAEDDRIRLGRDLHDGMIQVLYGAGLTLESARALITSDPAEADRRIASALQSVNSAMRDARGWISGLSPEAVRAAGLVGAVRAAVEPLLDGDERRLELRIDEDAAEAVDRTLAADLIPIVREAASNAFRHGRATSLTVRLERGEREVCLLLQDNGTGFAADRQPRESRGLANMRARAAAIGGLLTVSSTPGTGTRLVLTLPIRPAEQA